MAILKRCGNCGTEFNAKEEHDRYCGPCRGLPSEQELVVMAVYGMDESERGGDGDGARGS